MKIVIATSVSKNYLAVWKGFNASLFKKLNPPFPPVKLLRFDGSKKDDRVILELNFLVFKQEWESLIIAHKEDKNEIYFIDEGVRLPFFLKTWQHKHRIIQFKNSTIIIDEITFTAPYLVLNWFLYPVLWLQFMYRKPVYKNVFK